MSHSRARLVALVGGLASLGAGCGKARPAAEGVHHCAGWKEDVGALLASKCGSCHGATAPAGGYDVSTYLGALGPIDKPVVVAGDATSILLKTLDPANASPPHRGLTDVAARLQTWIVDCRVSYADALIHPAGILNPADKEQFHGAQVQASGWDFAVCQRCHGDANDKNDFSGGKAGVACTSCHKGKEGPKACETCHGSSPKSGAHRAHVLGGMLGKTFDCSECHVKPTEFATPGHLLDADGKPLPLGPAPVTLGALAQTSPQPSTRAGDAAFSHDTLTCSNVYCHGGAFADTNAKNSTPRWDTTGPDAAGCGTCHGLPPSNHSSDQCVDCHGLVVDGARKIIDPMRHIDGKVSLGDESGKCSACHGDGTSPGFRDLSGSTDASVLTVGAHAKHINSSFLRGPIACSECHLVPKDVGSAGHIDSALPAEVFPSDPAFSGVAKADGAAPAWDRAAATCSGVYCHGAGTKLAGDASDGLKRQPMWNATGQTFCGSCHGVPPKDANHTPAMRLSDCTTCHAKTIDAAGNFKFTGSGADRTTTHMNGVADGN